MNIVPRGADLCGRPCTAPAEIISRAKAVKYIQSRNASLGGLGRGHGDLVPRRQKHE